MTGTVKCNIKIHNLPDGFDASYGKYVVCRVDAGDFWYYGAYDKKHRADYAAMETGNGIVFELARNPLVCEVDYVDQ